MLPLITLKQFLNDLRRQKLRSALTMFGIFWGTCSIVLLGAFGQGLREQQLTQQKGMGENIAIFYPGMTAKKYQGMPKGRRVQPTVEDIELIKKTAVTVGRISPEFQRWGTVFRKGENVSNRAMMGVWPEFGEMRNLIPEEGSRFLNQRDIDERRRVIFIGNILKKDLFGDREAVGEEMLVNGVPFKVIGVLKKKVQTSSYAGRDSRNGFIPETTLRSMYSTRHVSDIIVQAHPDYSMRQTKREIFEILGARFRFDPSDTQALSVWDTTQGFEFLSLFFSAFKWFLVGIGITTLITGGIGVSNIMNVVLEERTKEIGIKMAMGARKSAILSQFVFETLLITAVGGTLGFLFALALVLIVPSMGVEEYIGTPRVDIFQAVLVVLVLGLVGFCAGIFPARRAANLQPVQALKLF